MKAKEIQELIDFISKSGLDEVNIETEQFKIKVKKNSEVKQKVLEQSTVPTIAAPAPSTEENGVYAAEKAAPESTETGYQEVKSPMIGTFYRSSTPDSDPFISVGDTISVGQTVCIIEAMKLFNEIESEIAGTVIKVLVDNSSPVEYDQPLFLVDPA
jgi:acetyl-CoA carboxylase biotin carboxyl carrier protein